MKIYYYGFISNQNRVEKAVKERKYILSFRFIPTQCITENSKQIAKKFKKFEEYHFGFISNQNRGGNAEKGRK